LRSWFSLFISRLRVLRSCLESANEKYEDEEGPSDIYLWFNKLFLKTFEW
jgi:hypothetical protein